MALGLALNRFRERRPFVTRALQQVLGAAFLEAADRGHRPLTVAHVALVLISDPQVARELEGRGVSLRQLYLDLDALLPPRANAPAPLRPSDVAPDLVVLLRRSGRPRPSGAGTMSLLRTLLRSEHRALGAAFERHGLTAARWPLPSSRAEAAVSGDARAPSPYRTPPAGGDTDVVLWNDKKTTQVFVTQLLRGTFGLLEPEVTRLVLTVDADGHAAVGRYPRDQAEQLAETATRLAREQGYPLRVSTERRSRRN